MDPYLRSLREELETCHAHHEQLMSSLHLVHEQLSVIVNGNGVRLAPEPRSALESVLATLVHALEGNTAVCVCVFVCVSVMFSSSGRDDQEDRTPEKRLKRSMKTIELLRSELEKCKVSYSTVV